MFRLFLHNGNLFYAENSYVKKNTFLNQEANTNPVPLYKDNVDKLPKPVEEEYYTETESEGGSSYDESYL